jgi:uncharacterized membrane protein
LKQIHFEIDKHPKQDFQVERLAFFSDAVFAIALTLLIIEFKVPAVTKDSTLQSAWRQLFDLRFQLFSLLVSFTLISKYWIRHHFLFKHIINYNRQIVIANLIILLPIIFFPFTTTFFGESIQNESVVILALQFFLLNNILAGFTTYIFYWLATVKYKELSFEMTIHERIKFRSDTLFLTLVFTAILIMTFLTNNRQIVLWTIIICLFSKRVTYRLLNKRAMNRLC